MNRPPALPPMATQNSPTAFWLNELKRRFGTFADQQTRLTTQEVNAIVSLIQQMHTDGSWQRDPDFPKMMDFFRQYMSLTRSGDTGAVAPPTQSQAFTPEQLNMLKIQLQAFKLLSRSAQVPPALLNALGGSSAAAKNAPTDAARAEFAKMPQSQQRLMESAHHQARADVATDGQRATLAPTVKTKDGELEPYSALKLATSGPHRALMPSIMPQGIDPIMLAQERERQVRNRIAYRVTELESMTANLPVSKDSMPEGTDSSENDPSTKLKALIELKSLRLLDKQKKMRAQLLAGMKKSTTLTTALARSDYRRLKKPSMRDIRWTEKLERQQRLERERKMKQKELEHVNLIVQHGREMLAARRALVMKQAKLGRAVLNWHSAVEKEEQKRQERLTKDRIRALKADDEAAYMALIDKQKDTRLTHLLQQTDQYLDQLSSLVQAQQDDIAARDVVAPIVPAAAPPVGVLPEEDDNKIDYYSISHRIQESVTEQPKLLIGGQLKDYQIKGLEWMVSLYNNKLNGILADEMGLGKTIQTISLVTYLMERKNQFGPFLIIVPLSTISNWAMEFEKWAPQVVKVVFKGSPNQRRAIQMSEMRPGQFNVVLTTYEYIIKEKAVLSKFKWVHTIIDEGHRMKNAHSKLSVTLTQFYHSRYRIILTGTPLQNNLPELWALLNFVLPKVFNSVKSFDEWFNTPFANTGERIELNEEEQLLIIKRLHKVLRPFLLRRLKRDVEADLPDKTERILKTPLSALQQKLYNQIRMSGAMMVTSDSAKKYGVRSINNTIMQLRKVCNHPFVFPEVEDAINPENITDERIARVSGKFELLDRILPKLKVTGHRALIFFQMTAVMDIMEDFLRYKNLKYLRLDGSTKTEDRSDMLKLFNAPNSDYFVFILSTRAGGLGLNLQSADTVIIFDSDWNPHQDLQAQDRAHRIVRILRLISSNSVEETILARAQYKLDIDGKVIQAGKFDNKSTNEERDQFLRSLFDQNPDDQNDQPDLDDDDELNEIIARNDEELEIYRRMDQERQQEDLRRWVAAGKSGIPPRLFSLEELPEIYLHDAIPVEKPSQEELGRGQRARGDIRYDDGLTDDQWARAIDKEQDIDDVIEKRRGRQRKRVGVAESTDDEGSVTATDDGSAKKKKKRQRDTDSDLEGSQSSSPQRKPRGRGRPRKKPLEPIESDSDQDEDDVHPTAPPRRNLHVDESATPLRQALQKIVIASFMALQQCVATDAETGESRQRCELFMSLPSPKHYPDYYEVIKTPIAMDMIEKRIAAHTYQSLTGFRNDVHLMFRNAKTYNADGSSVYQDAVELQRVFDATLQMLTGGRELVVTDESTEGARKKMKLTSDDEEDEA